MVYLLLADGFEEIEAIGTVDILRRASIKTTIVSISSNVIVISARDVKITADKRLTEINLDELALGELLILPGGAVGVDNLAKSKEVKDLIMSYANEGKWIAAICAAPTLLGKLGLLKKKKATCYPDMKAELNSYLYSKEAVVVDGNIITSQGAGTTHLFAAKIVEILYNKEYADNVIKQMIY